MEGSNVRSSTTPLLAASRAASDRSASSTLRLSNDDYLSSPADSIYSPGSRWRKALRSLSFVQAVLSCLCAGSITAFSLYGPLFQSHLHYTQYAVNGISIAGELGMYLPVPIWGLLCDRYSPRVGSILSGGLFGVGYGLAGYAYANSLSPGAMIAGFAAIGMGTSCMYLSAVSTCAKNFGRGKWKGISLAVPIAAFGLSGMWISVVGSTFFTVDGGDIEVGSFFTFLACLMAVVGLLGGLTLKVLDEEKFIDERVEALTGSGLLDESTFPDGYFSRGYGATDSGEGESGSSSSSSEAGDCMHRSLALSTRSKAEEHAYARKKKLWLLNAESRQFLTDPTMWLLASGFFLVAGAGEAFQNNVGTIIPSLPTERTKGASTTSSIATQVIVIALSSTFARLFTGTLSDYLAPKAMTLPLRFHQSSQAKGWARPRMSRVVFLLSFSLLHALAYLLLASSYFEVHPEQFPLCSALVGLGYGAAFSLVPIIISVVWGVENFATNWGVVAMFPAGGAVLWSAVYAAVYENNKQQGSDLCKGYDCYGVTAWGWAASVIVAVGLWAFAWRGRRGWHRRATVV